MADYEKHFRQALSEIDRRASALVRRTGLDIEADIKSDMTAPKHGRTYTRKGTTHTASAPGEAPAVDRGTLVNATQAVMDGDFAVEVGAPTEYAPILEEQMERPAWERAGKKAKGRFARNAERMK
jgi:hypothetical protein